MTMSFGLILSLCCGASALATIVFTARIRRWLLAKAIMDIPNARSSHSVPVPRGGGLAIIAAVTLVWLWAAMMEAVSMATLIPMALGLILAVVSWADDRREGGLSARVRFGIQFLVIATGVATLPQDSFVFAGFLPFWLDRLITLLGWIWFVNLYNFMDGIDGLAGVETVSVAAGLALLGLVWPVLPPEFATVPIILLGAGLGFLVWNWHPAKIFMGDVGSISIGFWFAWLLIHGAQNGALAVAIIVPLYFLADATLTLLWRAARGEKVWQAHRSHFYQVAARGYGRHDKVVLRVLVLNITLLVIALAWIVESLTGGEAISLAGAATASLLFAFYRVGKTAQGFRP